MSVHTLSVLVENKPGVLARIAGLFSRRGFNIDSLAVGPTEDETYSRMTIVVDCASSPLEQVVKQLNKVVNVAPESLTIEATGDQGKIEAMLEMLEPYGIRELVRTGRVGLARGSKGISDRPVRLQRPA